MAEVGKFVGVVIEVIVVALVLTFAVLLIVVVAVEMGILMTSGWLFNVVIVTIPAIQVMTNITNQTMIL